MPQVIDVPGQGLVEFPDGMSDDDIVRAIQANTPKQQNALAEDAGAVARGVVKGVTAPVTMVPDMFMGAMNLEQFPMSAPEFGETGADVPRYPTERTASLIDRILTRLGVPVPTSRTSKLIESAAQGAAGAGAMSGLVSNVPRSAQVIGGAVGGMAGEAARQLDAPVPVQIAAEVAGNVAGGRVARPGVGTKVERKLNEELAKEGKLDQTRQTYEAAKKEGVDLNIAEASDSGRMAKAADRAISAKGDPSAIDDFNVRRKAQIDAAAKRFMEIVSPESGIEKAAASGRKTAAEAIADVEAKRKAASAPLYDQVFKSKARVSKPVYDNLAQMHSHPGFTEIFDAAADRLRKSAETVPGTKDAGLYLKQLHGARVLLNDHIAATQRGAETSLKNVAARDAVKWKEVIDRALTEVSPKDPKTGKSIYEQANEVYAANSPRVEQIKESAVGRLADTADIDLATAPKKFFSVKHGPVEVSKAFADLKGKDPEAANQFMRSYLEDLFDDAAKSSTSKMKNSQTGSRWINAVAATGKHNDLLKATLNGEQYKAFKQLEEVLRATGRAPMAGSDAKWVSGAQQSSDVAQSAMKAADESLGRKRFVLDFLRNVVEGRANKEIAALMTDPNGVKKVLAAKGKPKVEQMEIVAAALRGYQNKEQEDGGQ